MATIRSQVLRAFKQLHRTRMRVFEGDARTLAEGRKKINEDFRQNSSLTDVDEIKNMIKMAEDVELILRTSVAQAETVDDEKQVYRLKVRDDIVSENAKMPTDVSSSDS